jgi:outer membrane cobalamin receptor
MPIQLRSDGRPAGATAEGPQVYVAYCVKVALAASCAVSWLALPAYAQAQTATDATAQASAQPVASTQLEEVVVTGSRIGGITNENSPSPVSVITSEEIALTKASNIEDALSRLQGVSLGSTIASNNGGGGASNVSLRDLGQSRTLILIDGQRLIPVFGTTYAVPDLNTIPIALVDRLEVLRDGASSIYGADAIGGVVNIITKKNFDGVQVDYNYGAPTSGGGADQRNMAATLGLNSDRGNATISVSWDHDDPLPQSDRAWAVDPHDNAPFGEGGSDYRSQVNVLQWEGLANGDSNPAGITSKTVWIGGTQYSLANPAVAGLIPNVAYLPGLGTTKLNAGSPGWQYLTQELDRKQISISSHYDITPDVQFVMDGFFTDRQSQGALRPEPLLGDTISTTIFNGFEIPAYAPGNTVGQSFFAFLTPDQFGPRLYTDDSETYRIHGALKGSIFGSDYKWEVGFVDQSNSTRNITQNEGNFEHLAQITGQINCLDVPGGCSPATAAQLAVNPTVTSVPTTMPNFFNGPNMFTPAQVAYLTWNNTDVNNSYERYAYANINGPLFQLPAGPLKAALGVEHRNEAANDNPDILVQEGWGPNQSGPTGGGYGVSSVYVEFNAPLAKDLPGLKSLTLSPSARYDDYSSFGVAETWKVALEWTPIDDVRFRGSYSTGFRAPSVSELYDGQSISDITASGDPCDTRAAGFNGNSNVGLGVLTAGSTCSVAVAHGAAVTNFQSGNNNQTDQQQQVLEGGNPNLQPEKSFQYGIGAVLTPRYTPGLTLAVDYYNIRINNTVLTGGIVNATSADAVLDGCYGPSQIQADCALIERDPVTHTITQINSLNDNFGVARVTGTDYQLTYDTARAGWTLPFPGSFVIDLQAEEQYKNTQTNADGTVSSYVGFYQYSNEDINPKWKALATLAYNVGPFTAHWDTRFYDHMLNFGDLNGSGGGPNVYGNNIPNIYYNNISGSYRLKDYGVLKEARFVVGVNNLLNQEPPFLNGDSICKCNTLAGPFDMVGRFIYARASARF